jgi:hypothetical protein
MYVYEVDRHADATSVTNVGVDAPSFSTEKSTQLCACGSACACGCTSATHMDADALIFP